MASRKHIDVIEDTHILPPEEVVSEIIEMGIIRSKEQLTLLKRVLGSLYPDFINSVSTYIYHRKQFDGVLDKFNNRKRLQMQAVELASDKPIVAHIGLIILKSLQIGFFAMIFGKLWIIFKTISLKMLIL